MKALLVTSRVTFVPENYDALIVGLADCPHIAGLLVLDNRDWSMLRKALPLGAIGARGLAVSLLRNFFSDSQTRRERAYAAKGKPAWMLHTINCPEAVALVKDNAFDLVVNARTRYIYKADILSAPRLGCINIHHGLLPEQRGTMCDLWALHERKQAGFSIHSMVAKVDAGQVISRVEVSDETDRDYLQYLKKTSGCELEEAMKVLAGIEAADAVTGVPNVAPPDLEVRRNPTPAQVREMRRGGLKF